MLWTSSNLSLLIILLLGTVILFVAIFSLWLRRYRYLSGQTPWAIQWGDIWPGTLFLLVFSGPPKFRERDPLASLRGDVDPIVLLHLLVWGSAGVWLCYELLVRPVVERRALLRLWIPQKLGLVLVLCLGASALVSDAPALTIFKVYQMLVMLLLSLLFVQRYGADACLEKLFVGSALLVTAIALLAIAAPDLVLTGGRLRGDLIAPAGDVSVFSLLLLCTNRRKLPPIRFLILFTVSIVVLILSRTRTAYLCMGAILALAILLRPNLPILKRFASLGLLISPLLLIPKISEWVVRDPESVSTLSDRTGLWTNLTEVTLATSPLVGLGYYSASRVYGPKYNPGLGTAHSVFMETFVGGGLLSITVLIALWVVLGVYAVSLIRWRKERIPFVSFSLLVSILLLSLTGSEPIEAPDGLVFWCVAAILPALNTTRGHWSSNKLGA